MKKIILFCVCLVALSNAGHRLVLVQPTVTPPPTPVVVTATPIPQIVVVTATPSAPPPPKTFWGEHGKTVAGALVGLIFGGILTWLLKPAFESLGKALANWLGRLGSGWGFRRRYLIHLIEEYRGLNIRGIKTRAPVVVELEQVYVSLTAQVPDDALGRQGSPPQRIGQAMARHGRLAILGGPGTGKSTLLAYLTLTYARGQARERLGLGEKLLPIHVPLRRLRRVLEGEEGVSTLPAYLDAWYAEIGLHPRPGFFERMLRRGHCLVLLDGLDEVADQEERQRVAEWVGHMVAAYSGNRYVVTSRPPGYDSAPLGTGFAVLRMGDFSADDIRQFAGNWCLAVEVAVQGEDNATARRRAREAARDLVAAIEANADIRRLAVNPLLLSIIALVHRYRATLPKRRVDLYAECVDVLLGYWDEAKGLMGQLSPGQKRAVLQPLALDMHRQNWLEVPRRELLRRVSELLPRVGGKPEEAADFVGEVRERSGLLVEVGLDRYAFSHLTFQEYLCARELVENEGRRGLLLQKAGGGSWEEVTLLYVGMTDATPIVDALLAGEDDPDRSRLLLAGQCVAEAVRVAEETRRRVVGLLEDQFALCEGQPFLRIGEVLAGIAGQDSVGFFLRIAHDDPQRRGPALWALGQMGQQPNEALRERVIEQLELHYRGKEFRQEASIALVYAQGARVTEDVLRNALQSEPLLPGLIEKLADILDARIVMIPAGVFSMGDKKKQVSVNAFAIDKYPVTNAQYKRFIAATSRRAPGHWQEGHCPEGKALHPVVYVTWHDAAAYAEWAGKRLPTEEEWEKAARGTDGREYPWGDGWRDGVCNTEEAGIKNTTPVGTYSPQGDSPYGCADMAGNVWEWTASEYEGLKGIRVLRGGSWFDDRFWARCAVRGWYDLVSSGDFVGFRCVFPISDPGS